MDAIVRDNTAGEYSSCYLAPEQFEGIYDARSDQYALGCMAYELITGRLPFAVRSLKASKKHRGNALSAPLFESMADLDLPHAFEAAIFKALARDPAERFFDFSLFLEVIQSVLSPPPAFPLVRSDRSHREGLQYARKI
jgi:serine/threonine protein kinase